MPVEEILARRPAGIILSGGPKSVHVNGAPSLDPEVYQTGVPVLGICYGAQLIAQQLGGVVANTGKGEYGRARLSVGETGLSSALFHDLPGEQDVWMSHFDSIRDVPPGFRSTAATGEIPVAALEAPDRRIYGVQFHPEVVHTPHGQAVLRHFLHEVAECRPTWTNFSIIERSIA